MPAKLLISVRSLREAQAARDGGAEIIDVKEPAKGSLGRAHPEVMAQIVKFVRSTSPSTIVSAALGEVSEYTAAPAVAPAEIPHLDLLKSGLSALQSDDVPWQDAWSRFRESVVTNCQDVRWVAAAYADHERSRSPGVLDVLEEGHRIGCPVLLIDTFQKDVTSLLDWVPMPMLEQIRDRTREYGMQLALAGRITTTLLPKVLAVDPDIIAVRGAVCAHGRRTATVSTERVVQLMTILRQAAGIAAAQ
ncbi:MAG: (5-formylfuran-3-yl)methyl phosphate synthase [Planctomycetaceae bacterium]|jgi:(5-formylfuran-3-yl)methyl phosphate synthase